MSGWLRRIAVLGLGVGALLVAPVGGAPEAAAHPVGNFTVNHYDGLSLYQDRIEVLAILDKAEVPTFQQRREVDTDGDGVNSPQESAAYAESRCAERVLATTVTVDGTPAPLRLVSAAGEFPPDDESGLPTTRVTCELVADADLSGSSTVELANSFRADRVGWREITVVGDGLRIAASDVPGESISDELRSYPEDLLASPVDQRTALIEVVPGSGSAAGALTLPETGIGWLDSAVERFERTVSGLIGSERLTPLVGTAAVGLALLLGASHAALPGHGKTLIAAYLAGRAGTRRDALVVGLTVTLTHTSGVLVLGLFIGAVSAFAPERLIRTLGIASGVLIVGIGVWLLRSALRNRAMRVVGSGPEAPEPVGAGVGHGGSATRRRPAGHGHGHSHGHGLLGHGHQSAGQERFGRSTLIGMGVAAGMVPSPTALLVLILAISLGRTWFGVGLVLAYGIGMAGVLTAVGLLLVMVRDRLAMSRFADPGRVVLARMIAAIPTATAVLVIVIGAGLVVRGIAVVGF